MSTSSSFRRLLVLLATALPLVAGCGDDDASGTTAAPGAGTYAVGTAAYHVVDPGRDEPETEDPGDHRELMIRAYYPAEAGSHAPEANYFLDATEALLNARIVGMPDDAFSGMAEHARFEAAPVAGAQRFPVLVFSPGRNTPAALYSYLLEDLASRGYVVFAIAHPFKSGVVVFPGNRVVLPTESTGSVEHQHDDLVATWSADQRTVIAWLETLDAAPGERLRGRLDLAHLGVFGHSIGGAAAAQTCLEEPRVRACSDLDGSIAGFTNPAAFTRPFLLMRAENPGNVESTLEAFWAGLPAPAYRVRLAGAGHYTFSDVPAVIERLRERDPAIEIGDLNLGTLTAARGLTLVNAHVAGFFDTYLRDARSPLLDAPGFPEVAGIERK